MFAAKVANILKKVFPSAIYKKISKMYYFCSKIRSSWALQIKSFIHKPNGLTPPRTIPRELHNDFTQQGQIPLQYWYLDNRVSTPFRNTRHTYDDAFAQLENKTFEYYGSDGVSFYDALDDYDISGKSVLIFGLAGCNCDAMALWKGAAHVYIVDYNKPVCEHERVTVLSHDELEEKGIKVDVAFSFSSFEHDGLGRYGDPVSPNGDFAAMRHAKKQVRDGGIMFFGVPTGRDCLVWNAHRIYGEKRLPLLLNGWLCLDAYSVHEVKLFDYELGIHAQPLLVLENREKIARPDVLETIKHADDLIGRNKEGTRDGAILRRILEMQLTNIDSEN